MSANKPPFSESIAALGWGAAPEARDPDDRPSYVGPVSFSQLPWIEDANEIKRMQADIAIIGAPFDDAVTHRPGTRFGPRAIREAQYQTGLLHSLQVGVDPFRVLTAVDAGDAAVFQVACNTVTERSIERCVKSLQLARSQLCSVEITPSLGRMQRRLPSCDGRRALASCTLMRMPIHPQTGTDRCTATDRQCAD